MFDTTIAITSPGTQLSVDSSHFTLRAGGKRIGRIPPSMIGQIVVHHGVEVTRKAMDRLGNTGVPVTFLGRDGRVQARLVPPWKYDAAPRLEQARCHLDPVLRFRLARRLVDAKIANSAAMLRRHGSNHPDQALKDAYRKLKKLRQDLGAAETIEQLMGHEGYASRVYFQVFPLMLRAEWATFTGRNRRPPKDPVNAVLSYCYGVLTNDALCLAESAGLDPYVGFLHGAEARRPNLALDLIEPFRPVLADRLALRLINLGTLKPCHFERDERNGAVYINFEGRSKILEVYAEWSRLIDDEIATGLSSPKGMLRSEVDGFARSARAGDLLGYSPFHMLRKDGNNP